jgi:hypothetical protein
MLTKLALKFDFFVITCLIDCYQPEVDAYINSRDRDTAENGRVSVDKVRTAAFRDAFVNIGCFAVDIQTALETTSVKRHLLVVPNEPSVA